MVLSVAEWDDFFHSYSKEEEWKRRTFFPVLDQILFSLLHRSEQNGDTFT